ncbi:ATP-binding cassette domain-containing protein [Clostridium estertheticum]|uniref:ATP-binding cassette domain-containing protein n=1 Tax=Clostridium estertheticum TaxID=238834 RepID=UPI001CF41E84|nr:ATP-binding cassette domain-containing protein [Clostridium estertheticum]MCB2307276.1 ATP-binding cassette domain-containing protein [Clostridium estertheticum]MCB2344925.1 ATP-binding cassette domain-containing protein [Clostridium estertheticum]MCB2349912.1 ATP-binding cassette domain-containing protein [Clostridium estertheticum]WAG48166.1 ATP-binding cassette domain-containing protein [Clostridium estertheticum]
MKISIKNVSMTYKTGKKALSNLNLEVNSPNFIGLLGPNGAGKSTFMKLLVSQIIPTSGEIIVDGNSIQKHEKELRKQLGYLPQSFGLYDELTVYEFLDYMCALKEIKNNVKDIIGHAIEQANLQEKRNFKIKTLSGGQRQRVGIAQVLLGNPELIILDEPTVGLDPEERIKFRNIFSQTANDKIVLLSTHIIDDIQAICNRIIIINNGTILFDGTSPDLIKAVHGHVGFIEEKDNEALEKRIGGKYKITSKLFTGNGISCRVIGKEIESSITLIEPTLEDAYTYVIHNGSVH